MVTPAPIRRSQQLCAASTILDLFEQADCLQTGSVSYEEILHGQKATCFMQKAGYRSAATAGFPEITDE